MNIAHLLPYSAKFPLSKHNGRYEWVLNLAELQTRQGHIVTIYCSPESTGDGLIWKSIPHDLNDKVLNNTALIKAALSNPDHDIFHSHFDYLHYLIADTTTKPIVFTQHWFPSQKIAEMSHFNKTDNVLAVPVTECMHQKNLQLGIKSSSKIYHGIDLNLFKFSPNKRSDRLIVLGRVTPSKGVKEAVKIAKMTASKLDIVGKINQKDQNYWNEILPDIDGHNIRYLGPQPHEKVVELLSKAKAFIFPSQQPEAFGQVTIEAQACGTPVIISDVGASNELVINKVTGFVAKNESEFIDAINQINTIDLQACRSFAERFDVNKMADNYEQLYRLLIQSSTKEP